MLIVRNTININGHRNIRFLVLYSFLVSPCKSKINIPVFKTVMLNKSYMPFFNMYVIL